MRLNRRMYRLFYVWLAALVLVTACGRGESAASYLFYEAVCPSCEETQRIERLAARVAAWGQRDRRTEIRTFDMFHSSDEAFETIERLCRERGIDFGGVSLPILFTRDSVYRGADEIEAFLSELEG